MQNQDKPIDVGEVLKKKNPALARAMPGFVINFIRRIIHEDEVNYCIVTNRDYYGLEFVEKSLDLLGFSYDVEGKEHIPTQGKYIFAANHPLGGFDGLILINEIGKYYKELKFIVNDILLNLKNLEPVFIPVNNIAGKQTVEYARKIDETYRSDQQVLNFPAGLCSRKQKRKIMDLQWKKSFIAKAVKYQRDIVPIFVSGKNSNFFYNLANIRRFLGIKANIEMFFLPDELFKQKHKSITIKFGKPISYQTFDKRYSYQEWANKLKTHIYQLDKNIYADFDKHI